jgi:hypothetical protein
MSRVKIHDARYLESRVWEEMERCFRYGRHFSLLVFEAAPDPGGSAAERTREALAVLAARLRSTDVIARIDGGTVAALLVETDPQGAVRALERMHEELGTDGWRSRCLSFPVDSPAIEALPFLEAEA